MMIDKLRKKYNRAKRYIVKKNSWELVYKEALYDSITGKSYNFKTEQEKIAQLVNQLSKQATEYEIFQEWLIKSGIIAENVPEIFHNALKYENEYVKEIDGIINDEKKAKEVYDKLANRLQ